MISFSMIWRFESTQREYLVGYNFEFLGSISILVLHQRLELHCVRPGGRCGKLTGAGKERTKQ